jgi:signal transduction histidine kinase
MNYSDGTAAPASKSPSPHLGGEADSRIEELDALVTFLHADVERHKDSLARQLHDDLGGFVIAALMDVAWIEQHESPLSPGVAMRLSRVKDGLRDSIDLARRLVEELRPTLLDSIGLFAALSWQFRRGCTRAGLKYTEAYPETVPDLETRTLIGLFRVVQEAFNVVLQHQSVTAVHLAVDTIGDVFTFELSDDGAAGTAKAGRDESLAISSILHRARNVGAELTIAARSDGGTVFRVSIPIAGASGADAHA